MRPAAPTWTLAALVVVVAIGGIVAGAPAKDGQPARGPSGWGSLEPSPLERTEVGAARIGDSIYVVGGFVPEGGDTGRMVRYDIGADERTELAPHPGAINHPGVAAAGGRLYVYGGNRAEGQPSDHLYRYAPAADEWKRRPDAPSARMAMAFAAIGGRLYAAGGKTAHNAEVRRLEVYDISARRWHRGPGMEVGRNHVAGAASAGRLYAIGGRPGPVDGNFSTVERYDPDTRRWKQVAPLETARSRSAAVTLGDGRIVAFGGEGGGETIEQAELFDPDAGSWSPLPEMATPRHGLGGAAQASRLFALEGGPMSGLHYSSANEYLDVP